MHNWQLDKSDSGMFIFDVFCTAGLILTENLVGSVDQERNGLLEDYADIMKIPLVIWRYRNLGFRDIGQVFQVLDGIA